MSFPKILASLQKKDFLPIYFFDGEEPYFMDVLTDYIAENALSEDEREFNQTIVYAQDTKPDEVLAIAKRYPMMAPYQVVIVKEAQKWKADEFLPFVQNPVQTTVLVINHRGKKIDGRSKAAAAIKKNSVYFTGDKLRDYQMTSWIEEYCAGHKISIDPRAANLLADHIGADLGALVNALDKLRILIPPNESITTDAIQKNIGISKDFNIFELQKALGTGDDAKALQIALHFAANTKEHNIIPTTAGLFRYFCKIIRCHDVKNPADTKTAASIIGVSPYFVNEYMAASKRFSKTRLRRVMEILHDVDLKSKGVNITSPDSGELTVELVARLLRA